MTDLSDPQMGELPHPSKGESPEEIARLLADLNKHSFDNSPVADVCTRAHIALSRGREQTAQWKQACELAQEDYQQMYARAENAEAENEELKRQIEAERDMAGDILAGAREAALREAAEFIRMQRNETPATGEEFAVALLSLIKQEPTS